MNLLFVCNRRKNRSLRAEHLYAGRPGCAVRSARIYSEESPVTQELLDWADAVLVFEEAHVAYIKERHSYTWLAKRIINLDILDIYDYGSPRLDRLIAAALEPWWSVLEDR